MEKNIITDNAQFKEIMKALNGTITGAFIRVSTRNKAQNWEYDFINIRFSNKPITIFEGKNGDIVISDNGQNLYAVNMYYFQYADIEGMDSKSVYGFLKPPCYAIAIWLSSNIFIAFYYWTKEE